MTRTCFLHSGQTSTSFTNPLPVGRFDLPHGGLALGIDNLGNNFEYRFKKAVVQNVVLPLGADGADRIQLSLGDVSSMALQLNGFRERLDAPLQGNCSGPDLFAAHAYQNKPPKVA